MTKRFRFLVVLAAAAFVTGVPIGMAIADDEPLELVTAPAPGGVPADQCPEAKALFERFGQSVDTFHPDCPPPERLEQMRRSLEQSEALEQLADEAEEEGYDSLEE